MGMMTIMMMMGMEGRVVILIAWAVVGGGRSMRSPYVGSVPTR